MADPRPDALAWSVAMLSHESRHVSGIATEAKAECYGMQSIRAAARALGRTATEGQYLAVLYWKHFYYWSQPPYWSDDCRNGGRLDLRPQTDLWP